MNDCETSGLVTSMGSSILDKLGNESTKYYNVIKLVVVSFVLISILIISLIIYIISFSHSNNLSDPALSYKPIIPEKFEMDNQKYLFDVKYKGKERCFYYRKSIDTTHYYFTKCIGI